METLLFKGWHRVRRILPCGALMLVAALPAALAATPCDTLVQQIPNIRKEASAVITQQMSDAMAIETLTEHDCEAAFNNYRLTHSPSSTAGAAKTRKDCVAKAKVTFNNAANKIEKEDLEIHNRISNSLRKMAGGSCPWTAQEITQAIATLGQTIAQIEQGTAQIISASKGGKSGGGASEGSVGASGETGKSSIGAATDQLPPAKDGKPSKGGKAESH